MSRYLVKIFDKDNSLLGVIPDTLIIDPEYRRRRNQATGFSFGVLADDERVQYLKAARHCILYRDGKEKVAGYVINRDLSDNPCKIECITNEALLKRIVTPANWKGWNKLDLADAVRDLLLDFKIQTKNTAEGWGEAVEVYQVDLTTEPGQVLLAKDPEGRYYPSGYITLQFEFEGIEKYALLRWAESVGEAVRIKVQYRLSANGISWSSWSTEMSSLFPAEDGIPLSGNEKYIQVRFNLYTDDTEAKNPEGIPTGFTPILMGAEVIARTQGPLSEGIIPDETGIIIDGYTFNRENALRILQSWAEEYGYEFRADGQKRLFFGENLGEDKTHIVLQRTRNMEVQKLQENAQQLINVLHCYGAGDGPAQLYTVLRDEESIQEYDEQPGPFEDSQAETMEQLIVAGQKYLQEHAWPQEEFVVKTAYCEFEDDFGCLDTVTIVDPVLGTVIQKRIYDEEVKESRSGEEITLGINTTLDNIIEKIVKPKPIQPEGTEPEPPAGLMLISGPEYIELRWQGNADYYVIQHSLDGITYSTLENKWTGRTYRHGGLALGSRHWYQIYAVVNGKQSAVLGPVSGRAWDADYPNDVFWGECSFIDKVVLRWNPAAKAVAYEIRADENFGADDDKLVFRGNTLEHVIENPALRSYTFYIKALDRSGKYSQSAAVITLENPIPSTPPLPAITEFFSSLWIEIRPVSDNDILGYNLYVTPCDTQGNPTGDTQVTTYPTPQRITYQAEAKSSFLVQVAAFDILGEGEKCAPVMARTRTIDEVAAFAQNIVFPKVVDELPELPSNDFPEGSLVVLSTDHQLYRSTGTEWDNSVSTEQLVGKITAGMIAAGAIGAAEIAAGALRADHFAAGSIEAYVAAVQEAFIDAAHIISVRADQITVGGSSAPIPLAIQPTDTLFRFDGSLLSTQGLKPLGME